MLDVKMFRFYLLLYPRMPAYFFSLTALTESLVRFARLFAWFLLFRIVCIFWRCYFNFSGLMLIPMCCVTYQKSILEPWTRRALSTSQRMSNKCKRTILFFEWLLLRHIRNTKLMFECSNLIANSAQNQLPSLSLSLVQSRTHSLSEWKRD